MNEGENREKVKRINRDFSRFPKLYSHPRKFKVIGDIRIFLSLRKPVRKFYGLLLTRSKNLIYALESNL